MDRQTKGQTEISTCRVKTKKGCDWLLGGFLFGIEIGEGTNEKKLNMVHFFGSFKVFGTAGEVLYILIFIDIKNQLTLIL